MGCQLCCTAGRRAMEATAQSKLVRSVSDAQPKLARSASEGKLARIGVPVEKHGWAWCVASVARDWHLSSPCACPCSRKDASSA